MNIRNLENAFHYAWGHACDGWVLANDPSLAVIQERMPGGTAETRHSHARARQVFYVLEGIVEIEVEAVQFRLEKHDSLEVKPGSLHAVRNPETFENAFLVISSPASHGDRIDG